MHDLTLDLLEWLVGHDTQNPPRSIGTAGLFTEVAALLRGAGFQVEMDDLGDGCVNVMASRGAPSLLFNVHLDTVPAVHGWSSDPHVLRIQHGRAVGLGACDVKGAAAALLAAASRTSGPAGLLLTSDEEAGGSTCVRTACASLPRDVEAVIVAEPTGCRAVISHRGLRTCEGAFRGRAGHGSGGVGARNAVHDAARWVDAALRWSDETQGSPGHDGLVGIPLNVGVLDGGVKANIAAPEARVVYGVRPLPGQNGDAVLDELHGLAPREADVSWTARFAAPALVSTAVTRSLAESLDLEVGPAVDFWTEAALFAEAGVPSFVFGPGDIAQAHTADEWIDIEQLERATSTYARFFTAKSG